MPSQRLDTENAALGLVTKTRLDVMFAVSTQPELSVTETLYDPDLPTLMDLVLAPVDQE